MLKHREAIREVSLEEMAEREEREESVRTRAMVCLERVC